MKKKKSLKEEILSDLQALSGHRYLEIVKRGNAAIFSALQAISLSPKKKVLVPEEGGWLAYLYLPKKKGLEVIKVKTKEAVIDLEDLKKKCPKGGGFIYQNPGGYFAEQPSKEIYQICRKNNCLVILDVSGGIGTSLGRGEKADILVCSFNKGKLINAGEGGFISCREEYLFNQIKSSFKILDEEKKLETIKKKIKNLKKRIVFLSKKRKQIIKDLKKRKIGFIIKQEDQGFVLIVGFTTTEEKEKIIKYCQFKGLVFKECPRYIRINQRALSLEIKRLEKD